jgi:NhaA family Na+:H+ antiporter
MITKRLIHPVRELSAQGKLSGILLILATILSLSLSNFLGSSAYVDFWHAHYSFLGFDISTLHAVNDGLMVIFFFQVGMEIKRELMVGELASRRKAMLPITAAIGGMFLPGIIYAAFNIRDTHLLHGWAIPTATDIAFSLGILSMLGSRVPFALKVFLTALAIIDDLGAIIIIALFYTEPENFHLQFLLAGIALFGILFWLNNKNIFNGYLWLIAGLIIWFCILQSGVHATIAGVLIAFTIPLEKLKHYEHVLQKPVNYFILPVFALANTAIMISLQNADLLFSPLGFGIIAGLFIGKPVGIALATWFSVKQKWCVLPDKMNFKLILGVGFTAGIGFTMSVFLASLSFRELLFLDAAKIAIIIGSVLSALFGLYYLNLHLPKESKVKK